MTLEAEAFDEIDAETSPAENPIYLVINQGHLPPEEPDDDNPGVRVFEPCLDPPIREKDVGRRHLSTEARLMADAEDALEEVKEIDNMIPREQDPEIQAAMTDEMVEAFMRFKLLSNLAVEALRHKNRLQVSSSAWA